MLRLLIAVQLFVDDATERLAHRLRAVKRDEGQSTAEYALVLLGAAAVAMLLVSWATQTNQVTRLLDSVVDQVLEHVS